ncbi:unnamed protein product [Meganyctiphanes norvegica]|uniref:Longin domain-containing protein n=1 Tax=Meganyctiphanes norvegica TaxID=48144 RepID=A0AAV2SAC9_MEGNR
MIIYASLVRIEDGTPLSATTDFSSDADQRVREGKRCIKLLGKHISKWGKRVCLPADEITIHCVMDDSTGYLAVCEPNYPHILAYSFLDEVMREFSVLYTASVVKSVRRPYAFVEFDHFLQKTRQKYNSTRALASRLNLHEMTADLNLNPPTYIKVSDIEPPLHTAPSVTLANQRHGALNNQRHTATTSPNTTINMTNGYPPGLDKDLGSVGVSVRLRPISWYGWIAMILSYLCILLDGYRGVVAFSMSSLEEVDGPSPWHAIFFITEMFLLIGQIFVLRRYNKLRKAQTLVASIFILILNTFLLDVREAWLCFTYIFISVLLTIATFRRNFERKLPKLSI